MMTINFDSTVVQNQLVVQLYCQLLDILTNVRAVQHDDARALMIYNTRTN